MPNSLGDDHQGVESGIAERDVMLEVALRSSSNEVSDKLDVCLNVVEAGARASNYRILMADFSMSAFKTGWRASRVVKSTFVPRAIQGFLPSRRIGSARRAWKGFVDEDVYI